MRLDSWFLYFSGADDFNDLPETSLPSGACLILTDNIVGATKTLTVRFG